MTNSCAIISTNVALNVLKSFSRYYFVNIPLVTAFNFCNIVLLNIHSNPVCTSLTVSVAST